MPPIQDRKLVALPRGNRRVFLSWRLLKSDPANAAFFVEHMVKGTWRFPTDAAVVDSTTIEFEVKAEGPQQFRIIAPDGTPSETATVDPASPASLVAREFDLDPDGRVQGVIIGDIQNNGRNGFVVRSAKAGTIWMTAIGLDGERLWEIDTHLPEHGGWDGSMHHVPFLMWDLNGDGRTEVAFHSYDGTYPTTDYDDAVEEEKFTVVDSETGDLVWEAPWPAVKSRVMMTVGHLDGIDRPASVVVLNETYGDVTLTALNGTDGTVKWRIGQARPGGHNLDIADIDGNGVQEVICGGICYNGDGSLRWEAEPFGHTDVSKPAHFLPDREGKQILFLSEKENAGVYLIDKDGETIWKVPYGHAHWSWIGRYAGQGDQLMIHAAEKGKLLYFPIFSPDGQEWMRLTKRQAHRFAAVGWNADGTMAFARRDACHIVRINEAGEEVVVPGSDLPTGSNFGRVQLAMDIVGDFRENLGCIDHEYATFYMAQNPLPAGRRALSPTEDANYLHERAQVGSGYYTYIAPPMM